MITWPKFSTKISKLVLVISTILVLFVLYRQAFNPLWRGHLEIDVWVWYQRMEYFFKNHSFFGLENNEFLPAALIYFFLARLLAGWNNLNYSSYLSATLIINLFVILVAAILVKKNSSSFQTWIFLLLVLFFGPILLFRFDTLVALLVGLSIYLFQRQKLAQAGFCLGWATAMKIYPIILLPYFLLVLTRQFHRRRIFIFLAYFLLALLTPVIIFFLLGGNLRQILTALEFHALKYVSIESLPGSLFTATSIIFKHRPPALLGGYGIWGITTPFIKSIGLSFFNYLWLYPVGIFYLYLFKNKNLLKQLNVSVLFLLVLLFLVFSKNLHSQYIWWFLSLFPFIKFRSANKLKYLFMIILLIFISIFNQLVYPLFYTQFIEDFYQHNFHYEVFYALLLRNLLIVALLIVSLRKALTKKTTE